MMKRLLILVLLSSVALAQTVRSGVTVTQGVTIGAGNSTTAVLQSITITPLSASVSISGTQQFTATGHYSDGSSLNLTSLVTWASSNLSVATISVGGLATGLSPGTSNVSASYLGIDSNAAILTVTPTPLTIITTSCPLATVGVGYSCGLQATGGVGSYTWSIFSGSIPAWATLNTSTGAITGIPIAGTSTFVPQVTDTTPTTVQGVSLTITAVALGSITDENYYADPSAVGKCQNISGSDATAVLPNVCMNKALANAPSPGPFYCVIHNGITPPATCLGSAGNYATLTAAFNDVHTITGDGKTIQCGSTIKVLSTDTGTPSGTPQVYYEHDLTIPAAQCNITNWMTLETDQVLSLPPEQTRINPGYYNSPSLLGRPSYTAPVIPGYYLPTIKNSTVGQQGLQLANGTTSPNFWVIRGLRIVQPIASDPVCGGTFDCNRAWKAALFLTGCGAGSTSCPDHIIFTQNLLGPDDLTGTSTQTVCFGISGAGTFIAYINNYIWGTSDVAGGNCETHGIVYGNTGNLPNGPYDIQNNFIESSDEGIFSGGLVSQGSTPTNVFIRRNHIFKPINLWKPDMPGYLGAPMTVKNCMELKNTQQALIEGNIMEGAWNGKAGPTFNTGAFLSDQDGTCLLLNASVQNGTGPYRSHDVDITVRYNWLRHANRGMLFDASSSPGAGTVPPGIVAPYAFRISAHDNVMDDIHPGNYTAFANPNPGDGAIFRTGNHVQGIGTNFTINSINFSHNTGISSTFGTARVSNGASWQMGIGVNDNPLGSCSLSGGTARCSATGVPGLFGVAANVPPGASGPASFTIWGLTGSLVCYNNLQTGCTGYPSNTTPATWTATGFAACTGAGAGTAYGVGNIADCTSTAHLWYWTHATAGLASGNANAGSWFSYWSDFGAPNYGPNINPPQQAMTFYGNIASGRVAKVNGTCQTLPCTTSADFINNSGFVSTSGPTPVNFQCNIIATAALNGQTTDTLNGGVAVNNFDTSDHTYNPVLANFNNDNNGLGVTNLADLAPAGIAVGGLAGCDGINTGANITLVGNYTAGVDQSGGPVVVDMVKWMMMTPRTVDHMTGTNYQGSWKDADLQKIWHIKHNTGNPWDIRVYDTNWINWWVTDNSFNLDASAYKRFLTPVPIAPRFFTLGTTVDTGETPGPNTLGINAGGGLGHCGTETTTNLGHIHGVTSGPTNLVWGTLAGGATIPTIEVDYFWGGTNGNPVYNTRERYSFAQDYGLVQWDTGTWNGSGYTVNQTSTFTTLTAGATVTPVFTCSGQSWWIGGVPGAGGNVP